VEALGSSDGCRDVNTNSGEGIFEMCVWKMSFHGATPMLDGVLEDADMVRRSCVRRLIVLEAILTVGVN